MCATRPRPSPSNPFHRLHPRLATNVRACSGTEDPRPPARASDEKIRTKAILEEWRADVSPQHWGDKGGFFPNGFSRLRRGGRGLRRFAPRLALHAATPSRRPRPPSKCPNAHSVQSGGCGARCACATRCATSFPACFRSVFGGLYGPKKGVFAFPGQSKNRPKTFGTSLMVLYSNKSSENGHDTGRGCGDARTERHAS